MNVLYLTTYYNEQDGVSNAVKAMVNAHSNYFNNYLIVCKKVGKHDKNLKICEDTEITKIKDFLIDDECIIHYLRGVSSNILKTIINLSKKLHKHPAVLITVCQNPAAKRLLLSPYELLKSNYFVFIDKTSYKCPLLYFINERSKSQIYLTGSESKKNKLLNYPHKSPTEHIIFGRGSTLSKCSKDMFKTFDSIEIKNKKFIICGIPEGENWIRKEAKKRNNVEVLGLLPYEKWIEICNSFDVYLYELPIDNFASIDGTLGQAMLLSKPVVYRGPDAPRERLLHGVNSYVAETCNQAAYYCTRLGKSLELRRKMGEMARETTLMQFSYKERIKSYEAVFQKLNNRNKIKNIPLSYYLSYLQKCWKEVIKSILNYYPLPKYQ